jgi:methylated-DNA-[protein]-cysteine S-methyltransferase
MRNIRAAHYTTFETAAGTCAVAWNENGISCFQLGTSRPDDIRTWHKRRVPDAVETTPDGEIAEAIAGAVRYFSGEPTDFTQTRVDLGGQTEFFKEIYTALRRVPYGTTTTYGELAKSVGAGIERSREVGVAMATNPVPLIVPCHRVLAAGRRLSGFSAPGGVEAKAWMLKLEGTAIEPLRQQNAASRLQESFAF